MIDGGQVRGVVAAVDHGSGHYQSSGGLDGTHGLWPVPAVAKPAHRRRGQSTVLPRLVGTTVRAGHPIDGRRRHQERDRKDGQERAHGGKYRTNSNP